MCVCLCQCACPSAAEKHPHGQENMYTSSACVRDHGRDDVEGVTHTQAIPPETAVDEVRVADHFVVICSNVEVYTRAIHFAEESTMSKVTPQYQVSAQDGCTKSTRKTCVCSVSKVCARMAI